MKSNLSKDQKKLIKKMILVFTLSILSGILLFHLLYASYSVDVNNVCRWNKGNISLHSNGLKKMKSLNVLRSGQKAFIQDAVKNQLCVYKADKLY